MAMYVDESDLHSLKIKETYTSSILIYEHSLIPSSYSVDGSFETIGLFTQPFMLIVMMNEHISFVINVDNLLR